jgi:hypothetical protein
MYKYKELAIRNQNAFYNDATKDQITWKDVLYFRIPKIHNQTPMPNNLEDKM